jgi:hypothetical protein
MERHPRKSDIMVKRLVTLAMLVALLSSASDFVVYDEASYPVTNRARGYLLSVNTPEYLGRNGYLMITNRESQIGSGVTLSNLAGWCVVDGNAVRLMVAAELSLISSNNAWAVSNATLSAKAEARMWASNVVNESDGLALFLRAMGEANWYFLNNIRTNLSAPALPKAEYTNAIFNYINIFGQ